MSLRLRPLTRRDRWAAIDLVLCGGAIVMGLWLSSRQLGIPFVDKFTLLKFLFFAASFAGGLVATSGIYLRTLNRRARYFNDIIRIFIGLLIANIIVVLVYLMVKPLIIVLIDVMYVSSISFFTLAISRFIELRIKANRPIKIAFFIGINPFFKQLLPELQARLHPKWKIVYSVHGHDTDTDVAESGYEKWPLPKVLEWLNKLERNEKNCAVIMGTNLPMDDNYNQIIEQVYHHLLPVTDFVDFYEEALEKSMIIETDESWYCSVGLVQPSQVDLFLKRLLDVVLALLLLPVAAIITLIASVIIRMESPGPAIFKQVRSGHKGAGFTIFKLRTMGIHEDDSLKWPNFEAQKVTKFGHFLRKTGLDEVPQILNILIGNMSFIGPRPSRPIVSRRHIDRLPFFAIAHSLKPGIAGWAQLFVGQDSGDETMFEKTRYNIYYAKHFSIWLDLLICVRTFAQLAVGEKSESRYMEKHLPETSPPTDIQQPEQPPAS